MSQSDIYKHFCNLPYSTKTVKLAIERVKNNPGAINNILKYLEEVCKSVEPNPKKQEKEVEVTKKEETKMITMEEYWRSQKNE